MGYAAIPTKLKTGAWGAKVQSGAVKAGDVVTITTASGKSWTANVERVLWTDGSVAICATQSANDRPAKERALPQRCARMSEDALADRGLVKVYGPRGSYVRRANTEEMYDL